VHINLEDYYKNIILCNVLNLLFKYVHYEDIKEIVIDMLINITDYTDNIKGVDLIKEI